jgi:very-short-patch-repair endonuclease
MAEQWRFGYGPRSSDANVRIGWIAEQQWGVVARWQLVACGVSTALITRWTARARLEVNVKVEGLMVDFLWREHRLIVEVDGQAAHETRFQRHRDHDRDLTLRAAGHTVRRYTWAQLTTQARAVKDDLRRTLTPPARSA